MWRYGKKLKRVFNTLLDVGVYRLSLRLRYELRKRLDRELPFRFSLYLAGVRRGIPRWLNVLESLKSVSKPINTRKLLGNKSINFKFLNCIKELEFPIEWNKSDWQRLWQFNLHYFDWARDWLEQRLVSGTWCDDAEHLECLLDQWIEFNVPGRGDGWHSYTLSLRCRNWIWLFRTCPELATPNRVKSLWYQLCWLQSHPEKCHGGNHWIENLTALAIGGLQFGGSEAGKMYVRAMNQLEQELKTQVLEDGGHEERTAAYHLLILNRLIELGCVVQSVTHQRPNWLVNKIHKMVEWAELIRLSDGTFVRLNDAPVDICPPIDHVIDFAWSYLDSKDTASKGLNLLISRMSRSFETSSESHMPKYNNPSIQPSILDLPSTGWIIFRPGHDWELVFKCGQSCPKHLPAHGHSDLLSFDLFHKGKPFLAETGTSIYGNCLDRNYERSYSSHNIFQLGDIYKNKDSESITWIEPIEVWGNFRAARKASIINRYYGKDLDSLWVRASHDAYNRLGSSHNRFIKLKINSLNNLQITIKDYLECNRAMAWRQFWHLGPGISEDNLKPLIDQLKQNHSFEIYWKDTWYSVAFGERIARRTLCLLGEVPKGSHCFAFELESPFIGLGI